MMVFFGKFKGNFRFLSRLIISWSNVLLELLIIPKKYFSGGTCGHFVFFSILTVSLDDGQKQPKRVVSKKGLKYLIEWENKNNTPSWETADNLICVPIIREFDDREEEDEDEIYEVAVSRLKFGGITE